MIQLIILLRLTFARFQYPVRTHLAYDYPLVDKQQVEYTIDIEFGSQNKTFQLVIDTGSSDLWVPEVGARGFQKRLPKFDCSHSNTCIKTNQEYSIYYDDGPIVGHLAWDDVRIGSLLFNQSFLLVERGSGNMVSCDGILGLGFKGLQSNPNKSILKSMFDQGLIDSEMFSLYLVDKGAHGSEIIFGGVDTKFMRKGDSIITIPLVDKSRYLVELKGISVGGELQKIKLALVDSGTSCLTMPEDTIDAILKIFEKSNIHCSLVVEQYAPAYQMVICVLQTINQDEILAQFPDVDIVFNNNTLTLSARDYLYGCKQISASQSRCSTKLERSTQDDFLLLGDAFLQSYYTIFDQTTRTIGFVHSINQGSFVYHGWQTAVHSITLIAYSIMLVLIS